MSEEVKEEVKEEAVESETQMTPQEAVAAVETAAKSFLDMLGKASETLKTMAEAGGEGLDGVGDDLQLAALAIGSTVEKVSGAAKSMASVITPQEATGEAEAAQEDAPAEEE